MPFVEYRSKKFLKFFLHRCFEVKRLGAQNIQVTDGRVAFQGGADMIAAANLNLRTAERVLLLLATYKATTFDELFDGCYAIAWEELLPTNAAFPVKGSSLSSQLSSVPACQSIVKKAIVKRLMNGHKVGTLPEDDVKSAAWLADSRDCMEELITALKEKELLSILTEKQRELYLAMTREGLTLREFARRKGIGIRAAFDLKAAVQKKFQRIF